MMLVELDTKVGIDFTNDKLGELDFLRHAVAHLVGGHLGGGTHANDGDSVDLGWDLLIEYYQDWMVPQWELEASILEHIYGDGDESTD